MYHLEGGVAGATMIGCDMVACGYWRKNVVAEDLQVVSGVKSMETGVVNKNHEEGGSSQVVWQ